MRGLGGRGRCKSREEFRIGGDERFLGGSHGNKVGVGRG